MTRRMTCATQPASPATKVFSRLVTSAVFAGAGAGAIAAALQLGFVQPVFLHAELYESGQAVHFGADVINATPLGFVFDPLRDGLSILFTMLTYTGYALIMVAAMSVAQDKGQPISGRTGLLWGLAGFVAAHLAPAFSLPPEVPGVAAADVTARQIWWFATVISAAIAMGLIGFGKSWVAWAGAILLLLAPHVIGAPEPDVLTGPVPPEIAALFASRALGVGLVAWLILGCFSGYFWSREAPMPHGTSS